MKYVVVGQNRETGARMSLEFEAESKAAAERKAAGAGMSVHRVEDVTDGHVPHATDPRDGTVRRRRGGGGMGLLTKLLILVALVAATYYVIWPVARPIVYRFMRR